MKRNSDNILIEWLVLGAQRGDQAALNRLVELLYPRLLRYALRQLNDREAAKDVVQSSFEVLSKDLRKVVDPAAFSAWIYQITHRKGVDYIRHLRRQRSLSKDYQAERTLEHSTDSSSHVCELGSILKHLSSEPYRLVHLYYLEGFSTREVASILRIPEGTVKSRLFQVRKQLKSLIRGKHYD